MGFEVKSLMAVIWMRRSCFKHTRHATAARVVAKTRVFSLALMVLAFLPAGPLMCRFMRNFRSSDPQSGPRSCGRTRTGSQFGGSGLPKSSYSS